jgi:hypothetical protein
VAGAYLEVGFHADRPGTFVSIAGETIRLGRARECHVRIRSDLVSRLHVELHYAGDNRWRVRDLGSSNGTFLNRRRIAEADLRTGDVIRLGDGGPKVRVVVLTPAPEDAETGDGDDDLEATRYLRTAPRKEPAAPRYPRYDVSVKGQGPEPDEPDDAETNLQPSAAPPRPPQQPPQREPDCREPEPAAPPPAPAPGAPRRPWPWLMIVGLAFGVATGYAVWPAGFRYDAVGAPALWASFCVAKLAPALAPKAGWLLVAVLGAYWGAVGLALQHLRRGYPWLILFALAHAAAYFGLERFGA